MSGHLRPDVRRMLVASACFGAVTGVFYASLNNYLAEVHDFGTEMRGWLEFPRELPGFLVVFVIGALVVRFRETRLLALAALVTAAGALGTAFLSPVNALVVGWIFLWSLGDHMNFALSGAVGLKLALRGGEGRRLGQFGAATNVGVLVGAGGVFLLARLFGDRYRLFFALAALCAVASSWLFTRLQVDRGDPPSRRLVLRREYGIFYAISALFGIRKQLFYVFGSWVLIQRHGVSVATIASLFFLGAGLGVVLRPLLGDVIDWVGERLVLAVDEVLLIAICLSYAFANDLLPDPWDLRLLFGAYILDQTLFGLRVARTTYLKKIAVDPADITATMSVGQGVDHIVAMTLPILSGYLWTSLNFRWVFLLAAAIALAGFFVCLRIRVPDAPGAAEGDARARGDATG
ncbi:MAG: MFS transporter [Proteobacteria bacterium]|nr:MFS transporter [Pseudomonadota bacterium]